MKRNSLKLNCKKYIVNTILWYFQHLFLFQYHDFKCTFNCLQPILMFCFALPMLSHSVCLLIQTYNYNDHDENVAWVVPRQVGHFCKQSIGIKRFNGANFPSQIRHAVWLSTLFKVLPRRWHEILTTFKKHRRGSSDLTRFTTHQSRPSSFVRCCGESFKKMPETAEAHMKIERTRRRLREKSQFLGVQKVLSLESSSRWERDQQLNNFAS